MKERGRQLISQWSYWYQIIRDTTDVSGPGFRINPVGAGDLQALISITMEAIEQWALEEEERSDNDGKEESVQTK